jgi:concanavalin A-like lectin/glucanase superfamily protein/putative pyrroloquinoline-quinone-binding quinoprotein
MAFVVGVALRAAPAMAATCTWMPATANTFNGSTAFWSCGRVPTTGDAVIFNGTGIGNCTVGAGISATSISINSGYTGTVTQSAGAAITLSSGYTQAAGTFVGGNSTIQVGGAFGLSSGAFTSTSGLLQVIGAFTISGGTFTHNSGQVMLASTSNKTFASNGATFNNLTINDGLVGYWKLDDAFGTSAADASGYGDSGTLTNGPLWQTTGLASINFTNSAAVSFDGANDYIDIGAPVTSTAAAFTACAWVYMTSTAGYPTFVSMNGTNDSGFYLQARADTGKLAMTMLASDSDSATATHADSVTVPVANTWYHLCGSYDLANVYIYVNGTLEGTAAYTTGWQAAGHTIIGAGLNGAAETYFASGYIDDVRIYNRALAASEINSLAIGNQPGTSRATQTLTGAPVIAGDLVIASGTLAAGTNALTIGGSWWNYGGMFTGTGTVTFNGSGTSNVIRSAGQNFSAVTVSGTGKWTLGDRLPIPNGALTVGAGTLDASTYTVRAGSVTTSGGTFSTTNATLVIDGSSNGTLGATTAKTLRMENPTESNLVGYWKLDAGQGTIARDYSTTGNTGTLVNGPSWSTSPPSSVAFDDPAALSFDGVNDYVTLGVTNVPNTNAVQTIAVWVNVVAAASIQDFVSVRNASSGLTLRVGIRQVGSNWIVGAWKSAGSVLVSTAAAAVVGGWHHVAYTYDGTTNRLYIDGQTPVTSTLAPDVATATTVSLGQSGINSEFLGGKLDDVRIYNTALSSAEIALLAAGRYAGTGGTATLTLAGAATVGGTFAVDSGSVSTSTFGLTAGNTTATALSTVSAGTLTIGSGTAMFKGGLDVLGNGTLTMATSGGSVAIGSGKTLTVDGTLNASSTGATIQSVSGNYAFTVGSTAAATPTLNVSGLAVTNTDTNGMAIGATTAALPVFTKFDNIAFSSGTGTQLLQIKAASLYLSSSGCTFDAGGSATTTYSVTLAGNGTGDGETRAVFGGATCATSCQSTKNDDDSNNDGVGDTPATNGAVVAFVRAVEDETAGTLIGFPTAAFDWNTFTYYSTYVAFHDASGGTSDVVYVRDESGNALYSWTVPTAGETITGTPQWNTVGATHYLYVSTDAGKVYRLIDIGTGTTSGTLTLDASGAWSSNPYNCSCAIVTPLQLDSTNLYFGGTPSGGGHGIWTVGQSNESTPTGGAPLAITPAITTAAPARWTSGSTAYLFLGAAGNIVEVNVSNQTVTATNAQPSVASVVGRISVGNSGATTRVYAGDDGGTMWAVDTSNFTSSLWSYNTANAIKGSSYYDTGTSTIQYGTQGGTIIVLGGTGTVLNSAYPYTPSGGSGDPIQAAPLYYGGILAVGSTGGKLYFLDRNTGTTVNIVKEYYFGPTESVSGIGYDVSVNRYMVTTSSINKDGRIYYFDSLTDPTPSSS